MSQRGAASQAPQPLRIAEEVVREPMFTLFVPAGVIHLLLGDIGDARSTFSSRHFVRITIIQEACSEETQVAPHKKRTILKVPDSQTLWSRAEWSR